MDNLMLRVCMQCGGLVGPADLVLYRDGELAAHYDCAAAMHCIHCGERIEDPADLKEMNDGLLAAHVDCFLRTVVGSVAHQQGRCLCPWPVGNGEDLPDPPPGQTVREAATSAAHYYRTHGPRRIRWYGHRAV